jgi:hypothetical protein
MKLLPLFVILASAVAIPACMVGGPEDDPGEDDLPPALSEAALGDNARTAFNFFVAKGLTDIQAAGIVGNLMQESSVRPTAVEYGGGPGRGIAQWSIGGRWNTSPNDNIVAFASARGANRWSLSTQLDFIWYELTKFPAYGLADLRAATTISQAVTVFQNKFERCGACSQTKRLEYARKALADYAGSSSTSSSPTQTCYSGTLERDMPVNACVESKFDGLWYQCANGQWVDRWSNPNACNGVYPL